MRRRLNDLLPLVVAVVSIGCRSTKGTGDVPADDTPSGAEVADGTGDSAEPDPLHADDQQEDAVDVNETVWTDTFFDIIDAPDSLDDDQRDHGISDVNSEADTALPDGCQYECESDACGCPADRVCVWGVRQCAPEMVAVPEGSFEMGYDPVLEYWHSPYETPVHEVTVPAFWIDRLETTVDDYLACVEGGACPAPRSNWREPYNWQSPGMGQHPFDGANWYQASDYCAWRGKRLCTESEWEKAARGTDGRLFPWGNDILACTYAVVLGDAPECYRDWFEWRPPTCEPACGEGGYTMTVGSKPLGASPYGALDMVGNVYEWVADYYHDFYDGAPTDGSAWLHPESDDRACRGGSGGSPYFGLPAYTRLGMGPEVQLHLFGIRCCRSSSESVADDVVPVGKPAPRPVQPSSQVGSSRSPATGPVRP